MEQIWAVGAMSGTSMDGVDTAELLTDGADIFEFGETGYRPYSEPERAVLRAAMGKWQGEPGVAEAAKVVEAAHIEALRPHGAKLVGFHGQTLAHAPGAQGTHQAGSGDALAQALGTPVVWDFRTADVGLGGQGAPLAPAFHFACARWIGAEAPVVFLNLGGVANITWVDPRVAKMETPGAMVAFDTGPANAPLDDLVRAATGGDYDAGGQLAAGGRCYTALAEAVMEHRFFSEMPPKSLDRNELSAVLEPVSTLPLADALLTLADIVGRSVARGLAFCPDPPAHVLVAGGGRQNPTLMAALHAHISCPVNPIETVGLDGDMLEAQAFAYLAVRVKAGLPTSFPGTTGVGAAVGGGRISRPAGGM